MTRHIRLFVSNQNTLEKMALTLANGSNLPFVGFGTSTGAPNEDYLSKILDSALEAGYRHIDTALIYGNEQTVGKVLKKWFQSEKLKREDVFITTKLPITGMHPDIVDLCIKKSLSDLQLDYVDLYLVHFPMGCKSNDGTFIPRREKNGTVVWRGKTDHAAIWRKMESLLDKKLTRYIGLSNYSLSQVQTVLKSAILKPSILQTEVHPYLQQRPLVDFCQKNGITVIGYSPLGAPDYNKRMKEFLPVYEEVPIPYVLGDPQILEISKKYGKSPAQIVLRFLIQIGVFPIPKSTNPKRMKENLEVFDFVLEEGDVATLRGLDKGEVARISNFKNILPGIDDHPDYPFPKL